MDRQTERQTDRRTDRQTDRRTDRQTDGRENYSPPGYIGRGLIIARTGLRHWRALDKINNSDDRS